MIESDANDERADAEKAGITFEDLELESAESANIRGGDGTVQIQDIHFTKQIDASSPKLSG